MRKLNLRWASGLLIAMLVMGAFTHFFHRYQMTRIASAFLREGQRAQSENRTADALRFFRNYVTLVPNDAQALVFLAEGAADAGRLQPAFLTLAKALRFETSPEKQAAIKRKMVGLGIQLGRYDETLTRLHELTYDKAGKRISTDGELWEQTARCHYMNNAYDLAKEVLLHAISVDPGRLESYQILSDLEANKFKNPQGATDSLDLMVKNNPKNFRAFLYRGLARLDLLAASVSPTSDTTTGGQSGANAFQKTLEPIVADSKQASEMAPKDVDVMVFAARVALLTRDYAKSRSIVTQGLSMHPTERQFYRLAAALETIDKNLDAAVAILRKGIAVIPKDTTLQLVLADLLLTLGKVEDASQVIEDLKTKGASGELIGILECRVSIAGKKWVKAIKQLEELRPKLVESPALLKDAEVMLAIAYSESDAVDQQINCYRRALVLDANHLPSRIGLAQALQSANLIRQACDEYEKILKLPQAPISVGIAYAHCLHRLTARVNSKERDWLEFDKVVDWVEKNHPKSAEVTILRAEKLVTTDRIDDAVTLVAKAKAESPDDLDIWRVQIALAQVKKDWDKAEELIRAAEEKFGQTLNLRIINAHCQLQRHGTKAGPYLKKIAQPAANWSTEDKTAFYLNFTMLFLAAGDYEDAKQIGLAAAEAEPNDLTIRLLLFDVALRTKQPELMGKVLNEMGALTNEGPLWNYGEAVRLILAGEKDKDKEKAKEAFQSARVHLSKAMAQRPRWVRVPLMNAEIERLEGNSVRATAHLLEAIELGERNPNVLSQTVNQLFSQKRYREADQVVRRLQDRQDLLRGDVMRSASEISMRLNEAERALELAEDLVKTSNKSSDKVWLAYVLGQLGRTTDAEQQLRTLIAENAKDPDAWVTLVMILVQAKQPEKARQVIADAQQQINPDQSSLAIAQCYERLGDVEQADKGFQAALKQSPNDMAIRRMAVEFYLKNNDVAKAEPLLTEMIKKSRDKKDKDLPWANRSLAIIYSLKGNPEQLNQALELIDKNLESGTAAIEDQRVRAHILSRRPSIKDRLAAIGLLEKLVALDPNAGGAAFVEDEFLLARLYLATGERAKGRAALLKVLGTNSKTPRYIAPFLQLLLQERQLSEAELWLDRLRTEAPADLLTTEFQVQLTFAKQQYSEVASLLKEVASRPALENEKPQAFSGRQIWAARWFEEFSRRLRKLKVTNQATEFASEAERIYQVYVQQRPKDFMVLPVLFGRTNQIGRALEELTKQVNTASPESIAALSVVIVQSGDATASQLRQLQEQLQLAAKANKSSLILTLAAADLMSWRRETDDAEQLYLQVLKQDPKNVPALNNLAVMYGMSGKKIQEALRLIQKALDADGPQDVLIDTRGLIHYGAGDYDKALQDFNQSLKAAETSERYVHLALANSELKQLGVARQSLAKAVELGLADETIHPMERQWLAKLRRTLGK